MYDSFDQFLQEVAKEYYEFEGKQDKIKFLAFLIASGSFIKSILKGVKDKISTKNLAIGAASLLALKFAVRYLLTGPLGIVISALTIGSLLTYFIKNQKAVISKVGAFKESIAKTNEKYQEIQSEYAAKKLDQYQRNLMIDGLLKRTLEELYAIE